MNGLDLFSGISGISLALEPWVTPVAYCELDPYSQGVLLSRMAEGTIPRAPIWDDVQTLQGAMLGPVDILYGGFPCQDISVAGRGAGLAGKRSGLFFEIARLVGEIKPTFIFLENVPAIRTRGADTVVKTLARLGYDCRWDVVSAVEVGAPHLRKRWFLLAHSNSNGRGQMSERKPLQVGEPISAEVIPQERKEFVADAQGVGQRESADETHPLPAGGEARDESLDGRASVAHTSGHRWEQRRSEPIVSREARRVAGDGESNPDPHNPGLEGRLGGELQKCASKRIARSSNPQDGIGSGWWEVEPAICRVVDGLPDRVDRLKCLGNSVVPLQAQTAFKRLMGLK